MTEQTKHDRIFLSYDEDYGIYTWEEKRLTEDDVEYIRKELHDELLASEVAEESHVRERMGQLLALTAIALKGPNEKLSRHSWHDLPEKAEELQQQLAANDALLELALAYIRRKACVGMSYEFALQHGDIHARATLEAIDKELGKW